MPFARVSPFMGSDKLRLLTNSYIKAQFSYCPLIWMFHDRCLNAKVNKIHEKALRIVYKDTHADYEALLTLDNAVSIHQCNLQYLMIEIYNSAGATGAAGTAKCPFQEIDFRAILIYTNIFNANKI